VWKLTRCTSCGMIWQRNMNAARNMCNRMLAALEAAQAPQAGGAP
jgi:transposase